MVADLVTGYDAAMKRSLLLVLLVAAGALPQDLKFAADRPFDLTHVKVEAHIDLRKKSLEGTATLTLTALRATRMLELDAVGLEILAVEGGKRHDHDGKRLSIELASPAARGAQLAVQVTYRCRDPELGLWFFGPTKAEPDTPYQVWSQGETEATRYWIPIIDNPNERTTSELIITAGEGEQVLSNGRLVGREGNRWHWKQEKDHVPYLITLVVGKFHIVKETWRGKVVDYWVPPDRADDVMRSFRNTKAMLDFFSEKIGVDYPWAKYSQVVVEQFAYGGMENTSATTLNERTLHDAKAALDYSSDGLVAHELAHQWFGDLLTCRDWAHTWLNEGFATYFEALWAEHHKNDNEFRMVMRGKANGARGAKKLPIVYRGYRGPWEQFDGRAYPKGAWVLHMVRRRLGDELWWKAVNHYTKKHAHTCVETVDLRKAIEEVSGRSFERFFFDWTERPGHPLVTVDNHWDAKTGTIRLRIRQTQKEAAFHFPLRIDYEVEGGGTSTIVHDVTTKDSQLYIRPQRRPLLIRVDPDYAVLMKLSENKGRDFWVRQLTDDPDPIGRIRAAEHFGNSKRDQDRELLGRALASERFWGVQGEIAKALGRSGGVKSRDILLQGLSLEHSKARAEVVSALAKFRDDDTVTGALEGVVVNGDASYTVEERAIRAWASRRPAGAIAKLTKLLERDSHRESIRNAALQGLANQFDAGATDVLLQWTRRGKPRPCRREALNGLGRMARAAIWDKPTKTRVARAAEACLHRDESRRIKRAAIGVLRDLGTVSEPAIEALEALAEHDVMDNVRKDAKAAIEKIRSGAPANVELKRLREELRKLREADKKMRERLNRFEVKDPG
jgi:aminopeptidase N